MPRPPTRPFLIFVSEHFEQLPPGAKLTKEDYNSTIKELKLQWQAMYPEEKQVVAFRENADFIFIRPISTLTKRANRHFTTK